MKKKVKLVCFVCNIITLAIVMRVLWLAMMLKPGEEVNFAEVFAYLLIEIACIVTKLEAAKNL